LFLYKTKADFLLYYPRRLAPVYFSVLLYIYIYTHIYKQTGQQDTEVADTVHRCAVILRMLIDARVEVDSTDRTFGMTALDMAMLNGDIESAAILICAGADVNHLAKIFAVSDLYDPLVSTRSRLW
jgi:ankyrin repeat protein